MHHRFMPRCRFRCLSSAITLLVSIKKKKNTPVGCAIYTLNLSILTNLSTPTSHISNTRPSKVLANTSPSGLFFVLCPRTNRLVSFFCAQNSSEEASSKGRTKFFLEKEIAFGCLRAIYGMYNENG